MSDPIIIGAVLAIVAACCLLGVLIYKVGMAVVQSMNVAANSMGTVGWQARRLRHTIEKAAAPLASFAPVRSATCKTCNGVGTVEKESPLWAAISEALNRNAKRGRHAH